MATATAELKAAGWAPRWWRDGVRTPLWWAGSTLGIGLLAASAYTAHSHGFPAGLNAVRMTALTAEVVVGVLFWMWRPGNIVGPLLVAYPVLYFVFEDLVHWFPHSRLAVTLLFFNALWYPVFVLMLFVFPAGRLWNSWARTVWLCVLVMALTFFLPFLLFVPAGIPMDYGVTEVPSYFYVGHGWSGLETWVKAWWVAEPLVLGLVFAVLIARIVQASPGARRRIVPLFGVFILMDSWKVIYINVHVLQGTPWFEGWFRYVWFVPFGLSAAAAAFGLGLTRRARSSVSDLVVELGEVEPGQVRAALARTLGDPSLVLGLWLPDRSMWADEDGRELDLPTDDSRAVTYVGDRLAVLVHDPRPARPAPSARVRRRCGPTRAGERAPPGAAARSARGAARFTGADRETGDRERRRLERDLHDGAQQRLLALGMGLNCSSAHVDAGRPRAPRRQRGGAARGARASCGNSPAASTPPRSPTGPRRRRPHLAERAPVPVTIDLDALGRLPGRVETAAYFVVSGGAHEHRQVRERERGNDPDRP